MYGILVTTLFVCNVAMSITTASLTNNAVTNLKSKGAQDKEPHFPPSWHPWLCTSCSFFINKQYYVAAVAISQKFALDVYRANLSTKLYATNTPDSISKDSHM